MFAAGQKDNVQLLDFFDKILNKVLIQQTSIAYHNKVIYVTFDGDKQQNVKPIYNTVTLQLIVDSQNSCKFYP